LVARVGPHFPQLSLFPAGSFSISRFPNYDMSLTTLFSLTQAVVVRLLARYASYPCLFVGLRQCPLAATYPAPGSYIFCSPTATCVSAGQLFTLWWRRFSSSSCLDSPRRSFFSRIQRSCRPLCEFWLRSQPVYFGLHTTPESIASQSVLTAYLPASGSQPRRPRDGNA